MALKYVLNSGALRAFIGVRSSIANRIGIFFFHICRPCRQNNHTVRHADGLRNIVCHENCCLSLFFDDLSDIITDVQPRLVVRAENGSSSSRRSGSIASVRISAALCRIPPESSDGRALEKDFRRMSPSSPQLFLSALVSACAKSQGPAERCCRWSAIQTGGLSAACSRYGDPPP